MNDKARAMSIFCKIFLLLSTQLVIISGAGVNRIFGGIFSAIEEVPYQLSVSTVTGSGFSYCGAVLISPKFAISAAHCFKCPCKYVVRAGSSELYSGGTTVNVTNISVHPQYKNYGFYMAFDIAILEFDSPLSFSDTIQPVKLPENNDLLTLGAVGIISGYGSFFNENYNTTDLRTAQVAVSDFTKCQNSYIQLPVIFGSDMFCAGTKEGGISCHGDSGGPFVIDNVLLGITSLGHRCNDPNYPGVYASIVAYRDFIRLKTGL